MAAIVPIASGSLIAQLLAAALFVLAPRILGPAAFGHALAVYGAGTFVLGIIDFGLQSWASRELYANRITTAQYWNAVLGRLRWPLGAAFVLLLLSLGTKNEMVQNAVFAVAAGLALAANLASLPVVRIQRGAVWVSYLAVSEKLTSLLVFAAISRGRPQWELLLVAMSVGSIVTVALAIYLTEGLRDRDRTRRPLQMLAHTAPFGVFNLATTAQSLDVAVIAMMAGPSAAGQLGAVSKWIQPFNLVAGVFGQALLPHIASDDNHAEATARMKDGWPLLGAAFVASASLAIFAEPLVKTLLGAGFGPSTDALRVLAVAAVPMVMNQPLAILLQSRHAERFVASSVACAIALQFALLPPLAAALGATGGAVALLVAQTLLFCALMLRLRILLRQQ